MKEIDAHLNRAKAMAENDKSQTIFVSNIMLSIYSDTFSSGLEHEALVSALDAMGLDSEMLEKDCESFLKKQKTSPSKIDVSLEKILSSLPDTATLLDFFVSCCKNKHELSPRLEKINLQELGQIYNQFYIEFTIGEDAIVQVGKALEAQTLPIIDLNDIALTGKYSHLEGRENELSELYQALAKQSKPNAILIGAAGVGKTAIVEMLADRIVSHDCPDFIRNHKVFSLDLNSLVAGTMYRGEFEMRIKMVFDFLNSQENPILFIDEIHNILGAGGAEGTMDFANIIKPYLTSSKIKFVGATTISEYNKYIMKDKAIVRRFKTIQVSEPTKEQTLKILSKMLPKFKNYNVTDAALEKIVELTGRFIPQRTYPDKAIDLLEEVISCDVVQQKTTSELISLQRELANLNAQANVIILSSNYKEAEKLKKEKGIVEHKLKKFKQKSKKNVKVLEQITITENNVINVFSKINNIPLENIQSRFISGIYDRVAKHVVGQDDAIKKVEDSLMLSQLLNKNKPMGCFMFIGSSRVGKTETAKAISKEFFSNNLIRVDCGEINSPADLTKIKGSTAGYVGYGDKCTFDEVKTNPYSVVLFDEIEKAHPSLYDLLLSILDEGKITDAQGDVVDFRSTLIILTSNVGVKEASNKSVGYTKQDLFQETLTKQVGRHFKPEFLNRLNVVFYRDLDQTDMVVLLQKYVDGIIETLKEKGINLIISHELIKTIVNENQTANITNLQKIFEEKLARAIKDSNYSSTIEL